MHVFELPSGQEVELRQLTGVEEELLTDERLMRKGEAINKVFQNCIARIGDNNDPTIKDVLDLLSGDRLFILVKLRQISLGETVELDLRCPNKACREIISLSINLEELKIVPYSEQHEFSFTLPDANEVVRFVHLDGHKESRLAKLKEAKMSSAMLIRILDIDSEAPNKKKLNEMTYGDRVALRQAMKDVDAGVDTVVEIQCEECGHKTKTRLEAEPSFLFPEVRW